MLFFWFVAKRSTYCYCCWDLFGESVQSVHSRKFYSPQFLVGICLNFLNILLIYNSCLIIHFYQVSSPSTMFRTYNCAANTNSLLPLLCTQMPFHLCAVVVLLLLFSSDISMGDQQQQQQQQQRRLDCFFQTDESIMSNCCWHSPNNSLAKIHMQVCVHLGN